MDEDDTQTVRRGRGPYAPYTEDDYGYDAREEAPPRRWLFLGLILVSVLSIVAILFNTYSMGTRERNDGNPPRIAAAGAYKAVPEEAGGYTTPGQDITVYDQFDGSDRPDGLSTVQTREELTPLPDPLDALAQGGPPVDLRGNPKSGPAGGDLSDLGSLPDADEPVAPSLPVRDLAPSVSPQPTSRPAPQPAPQPLPQPAPQVATRPAPPPTSGISFSASGGYRVQVAAVRSDAEADALWVKLSGQHADLMAGATKDVQRADLGEKGVFYRVRVGRFADRAAADAFCSALKARGTDCLIVSP